jgi:hypothetical protein
MEPAMWNAMLLYVLSSRGAPEEQALQAVFMP